MFNSMRRGQFTDRFTGILAAFTFSVLLAGCISEPEPEVLNDPLYKLGYSDGCRTAHTRVEGFEKKTVHRNEALYEREENYREGWKNGYGTCGGATRGDNGELFNERGSAQPWDAGRF
ncbi:50S ribosomal protein L32 [Tepidicaulis marinus]|uniref:50S ribosomal protein L32 n=1 Tax=Tepidicaulis marinus TaxID=1333998 RepID=A0A081BAN8_9HYPH|nr:hypothetical protein [Tepidicaulis marinus]GAK45106.1 50S ribosomal protein L32 [Tepidicaulis marinus]